MALWNGPTVGRGMTSADLITSALDQPMSLGATLWDQAKGGVLESFGLGTVARESMLPPTMADPNSPVLADRIRSKNNEGTAISEDEFKASPSYRVGVPYDTGMTAERQAALAEMYDIKKAREFYAGKRPITAFIGNLAGQATDPINYVPFLGPATKAAAVARFGRIGGAALVASADAALNTAAAAGATAGARARFGDDVSWETSVSQIATAALIGGAFGTVAGAMGRRMDVRRDALVQEAEQRLATLRRTQEARVALNDAVQSLAIDGEVRLSPTSVDIVQRTAADVARANEGIVVYHGTGASFDQFDLKKAGSGEGTAEEGFGVYVAEERAVAESYYRLVSGKKEQDYRSRELAEGWLKDAGGDRQKAAQLADEFGKATRQDMSEVVKEILSPKGNVYKVRMDADPARMIDLDKPVGEQTAFIKDALEKVLGPLPPDRVLKGADLPKDIAKALDILGVQGTKFLDSFSAKGEGSTRNYTVFDPKRLSIVEDTLSSVRGLVDQYAATSKFGDDGSKAAAQINPVANDNANAIAEQYGVNAETGDFVEAAELDALRNSGRLTEDEIRMLDEADQAKEAGDAFAEALKAAVGCML
jgi:hypothetical protein